MSLSEAAAQAGFGSYSRFHRAFRAVHGIGPRDHLASGEPHGG
jgi:AraC-like DNA-binding protein